MRFDVITLLPELFDAPRRYGVTRRAFDSGAIDLRLWQPRDHADLPHRRVDDRPYGGGPGMVMLVEPLERTLAAVRRAAAADGLPITPLVHFTPTGRPLDQATVQRFAASAGAVLLCGRYEGVDQRFIDRHVDEELSIGDFVVSGGELPALLLIDAVARLQPGVLGDAASHQQDSFSAGLLEGPHYSRPERLPPSTSSADAVPAALLTGHHGQIAAWRRAQSLQLTAARRPELIERARKAGWLTADDERCLAANAAVAPQRRPIIEG